jgi:hypothetical protein
MATAQRPWHVRLCYKGWTFAGRKMAELYCEEFTVGRAISIAKKSES